MSWDVVVVTQETSAGILEAQQQQQTSNSAKMVTTSEKGTTLFLFRFQIIYKLQILARQSTNSTVRAYAHQTRK